MTRIDRGFVGCAVALATMAMLACSSGTQSTTPVTLTPGDGNYEAHTFAVAAHLARYEESRLALTSASAPAVRTFAQQMVRDHSVALQKAQTLGKTLGFDWTVPAAASTSGALPAAENAPSATNWTFASSPMGKNEAVLLRSKWTSDLAENHKQAVPALISWMPHAGAQFDRAFMTRQVELHRYVLDNIDRIIPSVADMNLRTAMAGERTATASHLRMAEQVLQNLK